MHLCHNLAYKAPGFFMLASLQSADIWPTVLRHGIFLEWWNTTKILSNFWQLFYVYLMRGLQYERNFIPKMHWLCEIHANPVHPAVNFCPVLVCPQKPSWKLNCLHIFAYLNRLEKKIKCWKKSCGILQLHYEQIQYCLQNQLGQMVDFPPVLT